MLQKGKSGRCKAGKIDMAGLAVMAAQIAGLLGVCALLHSLVA